jgi:hypothetical protein
MVQSRRFVLLSLALVSAAAAWFAPEPEGDMVEPANAQRPPRSVTTAFPDAGNAELPALRPRDDTEPADLFVTPPQPAPKLPPKPVAPAVVDPPPPPTLPFRFLGRYVEQGREAVFVSMNERNLMLKAGDVIDDTFKVEAIDTSGVVFVHLSSGHSLVLPLGEPAR